MATFLITVTLEAADDDTTADDIEQAIREFMSDQHWFPVSVVVMPA